MKTRRSIFKSLLALFVGKDVAKAVPVKSPGEWPEVRHPFATKEGLGVSSQWNLEDRENYMKGWKPLAGPLLTKEQGDKLLSLSDYSLADRYIPKIKTSPS